MIKRENKLIFNSQNDFNHAMITSIPLNYFVQVKVPNTEVVYSYYISPLVLSNVNDNNIPKVRFTSLAILYFVPIEFILNTIKSIPFPRDYPILDFTMILFSSDYGQKNAVSIKIPGLDLTNWNEDGFIAVLYKKVFEVFNKDQYNLFVIKLSPSNTIDFQKQVFIRSFIFTLRKKNGNESFLNLTNLENPLKAVKKARRQYFEVIDISRPLKAPHQITTSIRERPAPETRVELTEEELDIIDPTRKVIRELREKLTKVDKDIGEIDKKIADAKARLDPVKNKATNILDRIAKVQDKIDQVKNKIENYSDELIADSYTGTHYLKSDIEKPLMEAELRDLNDQLEDLNRQLDKLEKEEKPLNDEYERLLLTKNNLKSDRENYLLYILEIGIKEKEEKMKNKSKDEKRRAGTFVALPQIISTKCRNCILNIKNDADARCFFYTVNAWYMIKNKIPVKNSSNINRPSNYNKTYFNWNRINIDKFTLGDIASFCSDNNVGVVLWELDEGNNLQKIINYNNYQEVIPLLMYNKHIMLIKDLNKFWNITTSQLFLKKIHVCEKCIEYSSVSIKLMEKHKLYECKNRTDLIVRKKQYKLPMQSKVEFKNFANKLKCRYVMVADYEALLPKTIINDVIENSYKINLHQAFMIGYALTFDDTLHSYGHFKGESCSDQFIKLIDEITLKIAQEKKTIRSMCTLVQFESTIECQVCNNMIEKEGVCASELGNVVIHPQCYDRIIDKVFSLKVIFHNFKNYDSHFIIDTIFKNKKDIFTIPKTKEKYTTIQYINDGIQVKFLDSYSFLQGSLDSLAKRLSSRKYSKGNDVKMAFPYEYIDSYTKLEEPCLPSSVNSWYSSLKKCSPSIEDINSSIKYFNEKGFKSIYDYAVEYMMTDVFLLLEIIYDFKTTSFKTYGIDPLHYYTLPGYAWDVTLNVIDVNPCLLKDESMIDIIMENIRGGISSVSRRKWLKEDDSNSIFYFDANNLYGWSMSQSLPYNDFQYIDVKGDILNLILSYDLNGEYGYILTVDLLYPKHLHNDHNELPFLPERINEKLCLSLRDKKMYTAHILNIKQAIENGLQLEKTWKIIRYRQSKWLEKYISLNTTLRTNSSSDSDKNFYKLMNNAVFGKTMQNPLKECKYIPVGLNDTVGREKMEKKLSYKSQEQWTDNLILYEMDKVPVMDKPIYIGFVILELSKWKMYDTFYNGIKKKWPSSTLSYMDTDSFVLNIPHSRSDIDFKGVESYFDLSVYPKDSPWYNGDNKGVLGKMKDEFPSNYIKEFICLRSKMYGLTTRDNNFTYKCKGITKNTILSMDDMKKNLRESLALYTEQVHIKSVRHQLATWVTNKKTLTNNQDDKRVNIYDKDEVEEHKKYLTNSIGFTYL